MAETRQRNIEVKDPESPMTPGQGRALFFATGLNNRESSLTKGVASAYLNALDQEDISTRTYNKIIKSLRESGSTGDAKLVDKVREASIRRHERKGTAKADRSHRTDQSEETVIVDTSKISPEVLNLITALLTK